MLSLEDPEPLLAGLDLKLVGQALLKTASASAFVQRAVVSW